MAPTQVMDMPTVDEPGELRRRLEHALLINMIQDPDAYLAPAPAAYEVCTPGGSHRPQPRSARGPMLPSALEFPKAFLAAFERCQSSLRALRCEASV